MKTLLFSLFIFLFLFTSCSKDVGISGTPVSPKAFRAPDTISYHDIISDTTFTATGPALCCPPYFLCRDSSIYYQLDVDADGVTDFQVFSQVSYIAYGGPTNPNKEEYVCGVNSVNAIDGVFSTHISGPCDMINIDPSGNVIDNTLYYDTNSNIYFDYPGIALYGSDNTDKYIGFKIQRHSKYYYGWILFSNVQNKMTLKSWALNKTANNSIIAGQAH